MDSEKYDVMISYNWDHSGYADSIEDTLIKTGHTVWRDKNKAHEYEDLESCNGKSCCKFYTYFVICVRKI